MTKIIIIAAVAKNNVIGKDGKMPWDIKEDLEHFKRLTLNHTVVMGRKTFDSLPFKPLKNRTNIVLTSNKEFSHDRVVVRHSLKEAIDFAKDKAEEKLFIIGGQKVYAEGMRYADTLEITRINKAYDGDTYFPEINNEEWKIEATDPRQEYSFVTYAKKR